MLAAALAAVIVTFNLADFPVAALRPHGIEPVHPDFFLSALFEEQPEPFLGAMRRHRASFHNPPKDAEGYVQTLRVNGLKELAQRVGAYSDSL